MKLISTLMTASQIDVTLIIQPRNNRDGKESGPMITEYTSKIGNTSLIFNPSIGLSLKHKQQYGIGQSALIPYSLFYRFAGSLQAVYENLQSDKLYYSNDGTMYVDRKAALDKSRRLSLFKNALTLTPGVWVGYDGKPTRGIDFILDKTVIGTMGHVEVLNLIDMLEHFDLMSYSLLAGMIDEFHYMDEKLDRIESKLDMLLAQSGAKQIAPNRSPAEDRTILAGTPPFDWKPYEQGPFER